MMRKAWMPAVLSAALLILAVALCGCASDGRIISETNGDTTLCMDVSDYTGTLERTVTIKNTQSGTFSVLLTPTAGHIEAEITDGSGVTILSMNEQASLGDSPVITNVASGNGTYLVTLKLKEYSGAFDISWDIKG